MTLAEEMGLKVEQRVVDYEELATFEEAGACGTAAVISPIGSIYDLSENRTFVYGDGTKAGPNCTKLYHRLRAIQYGEEPDTYGWMVEVK